MITDEAGARAFVASRGDPDALERLDVFAALLCEENTRQNLVSAASLDSVWQRHVADSAQLLDHAPATPHGAWLDLGTGAGFPGLIISILRPLFHVKLVESRRLRSDWLMRCVGRLELNNCAVLPQRVEALPDEKAAVISARAFAPLPKAIDVARRFSTDDTVWLLPKGRSAAQEVADLPANLARMFHVEQSISDGEAGIVVGRLTEKARK